MPAMVLFSCYIETVVIVCNTSACHYFGKKKNNSIYYSKSWFLYIITTCLWHTYDLDLYSDICKSMTVECLILVILLLLLQPATKYQLTNTFNKNLIIQICLQACQKYIMARNSTIQFGCRSELLPYTDSSSCKSMQIDFPHTADSSI